MKSIEYYLVNEYAFTFIITFVSVIAKGLSNQKETFKSTLTEEIYDFGPELLFIAISFAVSKLAQYYPDQSNIYEAILLKQIIFHLFIVLGLVIVLKRIASTTDDNYKIYKTLWIPLIIGFIALISVFNYTL